MSRVICDKSRCIGCLTCVISCLDHHYGAEETDAIPPRGYARETLPSGLMQYFTESCRHCGDAPCAQACPVGAIVKRENGLVAVDQEACIGCRACARACPFGVPRFNKAGKMVKCDGCGGKKPACVHSCPRHALSVG